MKNTGESRPTTVGALRESGYRPRSVKRELRDNLAAALKSGRELFPGIVGFDRTVVPQLVNAVLAEHDFILLGLRGQAKTRLARALTDLMDEAVPVLRGFPLHEDPLDPVTDTARAHLAEHGDDAEVDWLPRERRYNEKLATPDVTIADLIGDIDPIKAANLRLDYADERVIHYGIIPRTHRGIFCINELPDLAARIQVGLLNILEERDVQIRGFPVRLPLDVQMVFTANPEDYTHRGSIITPLKDRIESQILTHYPRELEHALAITAQEAWVERDGVTVEVPDWLRETVEETAFAARRSEYLDPASGVSARMPISLLENVVSSAERRALINGEDRAVARPIDFQTAVSAVTGKVELVYQGEQEGALNVARHLVGQGIHAVFQRRLPDAYAGPPGKTPDEEALGPYKKIISWFAGGEQLVLDDTAPTAEAFKTLQGVPGLEDLAREHLLDGAGDAPDDRLVSAMEFVLEGLHHARLVSKDEVDGSGVYKDMLGSMFEDADLGQAPPPRER